MNPFEVFREQMKNAHDWLDATMADVTDETAHFVPPGTAHPIGSRYAHALVAEDVLVSSMLMKTDPLNAGMATGLEDPMAAFGVTLEWAQNVRVDLEALRAYGQAVYSRTDEYLAGLTPEDMDREVDMTAQGYGKWTLGGFFLSFLFAHVHQILGEIAAVKGMQGMKGSPF